MSVHVSDQPFAVQQALLAIDVEDYQTLQDSRRESIRKGLLDEHVPVVTLTAFFCTLGL
jgi:hypothetical protein